MLVDCESSERRGRGSRNPELLLVGTVHLILQFLQEMSALFRRQLPLQFLERQGHDVIVVGPRKFRIGCYVEP
jgi:hypothetical protein